MIKVIITGSTGMVGEGVLHECLKHPSISEVLVINRKPCKVAHHKLNEIILPDFLNPDSISSVVPGYDACYFCLGVTSLGKKEPEYHTLTYDLTIKFAKVLVRQNPEMTFCYISGLGTDNSEKGKIMWARVKGKTENALMMLPFKKVVVFRPGLIIPTPGLKNTLSVYKWFRFLIPALKKIFPKSFSTLGDIGLAMIGTQSLDSNRLVLETKDINTLAHTSHVS